MRRYSRNREMIFDYAKERVAKLSSLSLDPGRESMTKK